MGKVVAVCVADKRGMRKENRERGIFIKNMGIKEDAHAGKWHRQVSLLSFESVREFCAKGADVTHGDFGENLLVEGIDFKALPIGTRLCCNDVLLEITQIGKQCHSHCEIYQRMGECIMPKEGVFAKVLCGGVIAVGDELYVRSIPAQAV